MEETLDEGREAEHSVLHAFGFRWRPEATPALKERALLAILALKGVVPGLLEVHVGPNLSEKGAGYTFAGVMRFANRSSLDAYAHHSAHEELLTWLVPLVDAIELDIEI